MYYPNLDNLKERKQVKKKLQDISYIRTGLVLNRYKFTSKSKEIFTYKQVGLRCFTSSIFLDKDKAEVFEAERLIDSKYFTQKGDVLIRLRAPMSAVYITEETEGLLIPSLLAVVRVNKKFIDSKYLAYYLNTKYVKRILAKEIKGTSIPMIKTGNIETLELIDPLISEQKKLVSLLDLAQKEQDLLQKLINEKKQLSQTILDTIIQQNKEDK